MNLYRLRSSQRNMKRKPESQSLWQKSMKKTSAPFGGSGPRQYSLITEGGQKSSSHLKQISDTVYLFIIMSRMLSFSLPNLLIPNSWDASQSYACSMHSSRCSSTSITCMTVCSGIILSGTLQMVRSASVSFTEIKASLAVYSRRKSKEE